MLRTELNSTLLNAVAYLDRQALLELEFRSGAIYHYAGVPAETYRGLLLAESKGTYFNHHIRNRFPTSKSAARNQPAVAIPTPLGCLKSNSVG